MHYWSGWSEEALAITTNRILGYMATTVTILRILKTVTLQQSLSWTRLLHYPKTQY